MSIQVLCPILLIPPPADCQMRMDPFDVDEVFARPGLIQEEIGERSMVKAEFFKRGKFRYMNDGLHVEDKSPCS